MGFKDSLPLGSSMGSCLLLFIGGDLSPEGLSFVLRFRVWTCTLNTLRLVPSLGLGQFGVLKTARLELLSFRVCGAWL